MAGRASPEQRWAQERNWEIFAAKGNIALWKKFCNKYNLEFDDAQTEMHVLELIKEKYDDKRKFQYLKQR